MKIIIIVLYFGKLPANFNLWLNSCKKNKIVDWIFITDNIEIKIYEEKNFKVINTSLKNLKSKFEKVLKFEINLEKPYKLCDYKPAYGYLFKEEIKGYDFWGYCDIDLVFGKLENFLTEDLLTTYDKILRNGHFTLYRNTENINEIFKQKIIKTLDYKKVYNTDISCGFDESKKGVYGKSLEINKKQYLKKNFVDINPKIFNFLEKREKKACYTYENGKIFSNILKKDKLEKKEILYIHFQKRNIQCPNKIDTNLKYIISNKVISFDSEEEIIDYIKKIKNNILKDLYCLIKFYYQNIQNIVKFKYFYIKNLLKEGLEE
jgi:hypothetical protein